MKAEEIQGLVLYSDGQVLIINKPAGIPVHAGPKGGVNLEQYFEHLRFGLSHNPSLAHRLDRDTSGCLILGRHRKSLARMGKLFSSGQVSKTYWAIVHGKMPENKGTIDMPLAKRSTEARGWWMMPDPAGQSAITDYRVLGHDEKENISWVEFLPRTGRTHQLRVHAAESGCPILGDRVYGRPEDKDAGLPLQLHARSLEFPLYPGKPAVAALAPPPAHMMEPLLRCGYAP